MCLSPIIVKNPWFCPDVPKLRNAFEARYPYWFLHDTTSPNMKVPCGLCAECLQARQNEFVQRCYEMSKFNYVIFGTLTYGDWALPRINVNGRELKVPDIRDFQNFIKRLRKSEILPNFRYLAVTEYGDDKFEEGILVHKSKHRPHFHFLIFIPFDFVKGQKDEFQGYTYAERLLNFIASPIGWYRNYGDISKPLYIPNSAFIRTLKNYTYDAQFVPNSTDRNVVYYVTKYVLKFSDYVKRLQQALRLNLTPEDYYKIWYFVRPKVLCSKGLGIKQVTGCDWPCDYIDGEIDKDLTEQIEFSSVSENLPMIYIDNVPMPLCEYYKKRLVTLEQKVKFHNNQFELGPFEDSYIIPDISLNDFETDITKSVAKQQKYDEIKKRLENNLY